MSKLPDHIRPKGLGARVHAFQLSKVGGIVTLLGGIGGLGLFLFMADQLDLTMSPLIVIPGLILGITLTGLSFWTWMTRQGWSRKTRVVLTCLALTVAVVGYGRSLTDRYEAWANSTTTLVTPSPNQKNMPTAPPPTQPLAPDPPKASLSAPAVILKSDTNTAVNLSDLEQAKLDPILIVEKPIAIKSGYALGDPQFDITIRNSGFPEVEVTQIINDVYLVTIRPGGDLGISGGKPQDLAQLRDVEDNHYHKEWPSFALKRNEKRQYRVFIPYEWIAENVCIAHLIVHYRRTVDGKPFRGSYYFVYQGVEEGSRLRTREPLEKARTGDHTLVEIAQYFKGRPVADAIKALIEARGR